MLFRSISLNLCKTDRGNSQYDLTDAKRKLNLPIARLDSYENKVLSTNDISSIIKRALIRNFGQVSHCSRATTTKK